MFKNPKTLALAMILTWGLMIPATSSQASETDALSDLLNKVDDLVCTAPKKINEFYNQKLVIMSDDKRILLENRVSDYEMMIAELEEMECKFKRTVLAGNVGEKVAYLLVDELISVSSRASIDERQHSVCTYGFVKENNRWKITHEHCSSLPDYSIAPGDDALYYFHNPVY